MQKAATHILLYLHELYILHLTQCMPSWKQCHQHTVITLLLTSCKTHSPDLVQTIIQCAHWGTMYTVSQLYILHLTLCMPSWKQCHQHTVITLLLTSCKTHSPDLVQTIIQCAHWGTMYTVSQLYTLHLTQCMPSWKQCHQHTVITLLLTSCKTHSPDLVQTIIQCAHWGTMYTG